MTLLPPLRDPQDASPVCCCDKCGGEIYSEYGAFTSPYGSLTYCEICYERLGDEYEQESDAACEG